MIFFHHRNTIDRIIGVGATDHFKIAADTAVLPPAWRLLLYAYACERERVCVCMFVSVPNAMWASAYGGARQNVIDIVHVQNYIAADTEKT